MTSTPETKKAARVRENLVLRERLREIRVAAGRHPQGYGNRADRYVTHADTRADTRADTVVRDPEDGTEILMATTVYDSAREQETGLVSPAGLPLYRVRDTVPIGFHGRKK
jgi:hypothetical protein